MSEFWRKTTVRGQETVAVWREYLPLMTVGGTGVDGFAAELGSLGELAQVRDDRSADVEMEKHRERAGYQAIRSLNLAVPKLIEGELADEHPLRELLGAIYALVPQTNALNLKRARKLIPLWKKANAAVAALNPGDAIVRGTTGVAEFTQMVVDFPPLSQATSDAQMTLRAARGELRTRSRQVDRMNKRIYLKLKSEARSDPALKAALLAQVTRERTTRKRVVRSAVIPSDSLPQEV